jgi:hypothetical protein
MIDLTEIRLARALGRAIDSCISKGDVIPTEILEAYAELHRHWNEQIERELS